MSAEKRCDRCGRVGQRGFRLIGGWYDALLNETPPLQTVCAAVTACLKRLPASPEPQGDKR